MVTVLADGREDRFERRLLAGRRVEQLGLRDADVAHRISSNLLGDHLDAPAPFERPNHRWTHARRLDECGEGRGAAARLQLLDGALLRLGSAPSGARRVGDEADDVLSLRLHARLADPLLDADEALALELAGERVRPRRRHVLARVARAKRPRLCDACERLHDGRAAAPLPDRRERHAAGVGDRQIDLGRRREAGRQRRLQALAPRRVVVVGDPLRQTKNLLGDDRVLVDELLDVLDRRRLEPLGRLVVDRDDVARDELVADRHEHPAARRGALGEHRRQTVRVGLSHVERDGDLGVLVDEERAHDGFLRTATTRCVKYSRAIGTRESGANSHA